MDVAMAHGSSSDMHDDTGRPNKSSLHQCLDLQVNWQGWQVAPRISEVWMVLVWAPERQSSDFFRVADVDLHQNIGILGAGAPELTRCGRYSAYTPEKCPLLCYHRC